MSDTLLDEITREPLFQQGEPYTLRQFIKIAKKSAEGKKAYKGSYNFGKGIQLAEYLRKNIPGIAKSMKATVYRSAWNYGGNLTVTIELGGKSYNQKSLVLTLQTLRDNQITHLQQCLMVLLSHLILVQDKQTSVWAQFTVHISLSLTSINSCQILLVSSMTSREYMV
jgi:hypothetical protein